MMASVKIAAQIAPQRSTQYSSLVKDLAALELLAFSPEIAPMEMLQLGGIDYVVFAADSSHPLVSDLELLGTLAAFSGFFQVIEEAGTGEVLLKPLSRQYSYFLPQDIAFTRRYRGKTNELFTHFLLNVAKFASDYRCTSWRQLKVLDPLCGGGTTLFLALALGADVAGVEQDVKDCETTAAFLEQYARENRIPIRVHEERLKNTKKGRRWSVQIGKAETKKFILATGETSEAPHLVAALGRTHLIVTDLPYGIQHHGPIRELVSQALPIWATLLKPGGAIAFSWDATRFPRDEMAPLVEAAGLETVNHDPYGRMLHRVDRVIKRRDVIVARHRQA